MCDADCRGSDVPTVPGRGAYTACTRGQGSHNALRDVLVSLRSLKAAGTGLGYIYVDFVVAILPFDVAVDVATGTPYVALDSSPLALLGNDVVAMSHLLWLALWRSGARLWRNCVRARRLSISRVGLGA